MKAHILHEWDSEKLRRGEPLTAEDLKPVGIYLEPSSDTDQSDLENILAGYTPRAQLGFGRDYETGRIMHVQVILDPTGGEQ